MGSVAFINVADLFLYYRIKVSKALFFLYLAKCTKYPSARSAQKHSDEPPKPEIVFSKGFHDSLSLISIVRKVATSG